MNEIKVLELTSLKSSPLNPRVRFDEVKLNELSLSIKEKGVIEPLIVRPSNGKFEIVCGDRRFRASKLAGLKEVPAIVKTLTDTQALEFQIIENLQRDDLDPIDEATGFKSLLEKCKYTQEQLAGKIGKSQEYINNRLRLLTLPIPITDAISREIITPGHAVVLMRLKDPKQQTALFAKIKEEKLSVRAAENELGEFSKSLQKAPFDKTECLKCPRSGAAQKGLFDEDTKLTGECLDHGCFTRKLDQFINQRIADLKKKGFEVITQQKFEAIPNRGASYDLSEEGYRRKDLGDNYKAKCLAKCPHHFYVLSKPRWDHELPQIKEICSNSRCLDILCRPKSAKGEDSQASYRKEQLDRSSGMHTLEAKQRFWKEKINKHKTPAIDHATALYFLLSKLDPYGNEFDASLLPKEIRPHKYGGWSIKSIYQLGDKKVLELIPKVVGRLMENWVDDEDLEFLTATLKFDVTKDYIIEETYLNTKVKTQLVKLAKEIGLDKYLKEKKICEPDKIGMFKKPEIISFFLKKGLNLEGKVPKDFSKK